LAAHLVPTMTGLVLELPSGRPQVANLNLLRHTPPTVP
jgi:hypothetical protein